MEKLQDSNKFIANMNQTPTILPFADTMMVEDYMKCIVSECLKNDSTGDKAIGELFSNSINNSYDDKILSLVDKKKKKKYKKNINKHRIERVSLDFPEMKKIVEVTYELIEGIINNHLHNLRTKDMNIEKTLQAIKNSTKDMMTLNDLYCYISDFCANKASFHPHYNTLAARISVKRLHDSTYSDFATITNILYTTTDKDGQSSPLLSDEYYKVAISNSDEINKMLRHERDYEFDYFAIKTLERSYLYKSHNPNEVKYYSNDSTGQLIERPQHMIMRVAIEIHRDDLVAVKETYDMISNKYFTHATPTLFNAGCRRPQLSSCFLLHMEDTIEGIFGTISKIAYISKWAGGIGVDLTSIRAKGSLIRGTNGLSDGIVPLCILLDKLSKYINQGGKRNGSIAVYLQTWHADIFPMCELRKNTKDEESKARNLFLGLWISDLFMKRVLNDEMWSLMCPDECPGLVLSYGDEFEKLYTKYESEKKYKRQVRAVDLFYHIMECQIETGMPYMLFKDHVNNKSNQMNIGPIRSSNLCVDGDTKIFTNQGYINIKSKVNKKVSIWNGKEWSNVTIRQTGQNKDLVRVTLSNGEYIDCTPEHKFYLQKEYHTTVPTEIEAKDLKKSDKLIKWDLPQAISFTKEEEFKYPYTHGFFCGDGTTYDNYSKTLKYPKIYLYGEKKLLLPYLDYTHQSENKANDRIDVVVVKDINDKFTLPINSDIETRLRWFEGYCDADGTISRNGTNESLQITSINVEFLRNVRLLLHTLGIESKVAKSKNARMELLPDGKGGKQMYNCKSIWRLLISSSGLFKLSELGFAPKRLKFTKCKPQRNAEGFVRIISVEPSKKNVNTYCFTEPKRHMGMFNGILTGQCSEIVEYTDSEQIAVCNLGSICLPQFIKQSEGKVSFDYEKLIYVTRILVRNLNKVLKRNFNPTEEGKYSNEQNAPIGIGVQGLADTYIIHRYPFGSPEAYDLNKRIFETIYYAAISESCALAKEQGAYPKFKGSPFSKGQLQFHLWGLKEEDLLMGYDWKTVINDVKKYGTNSLLTALMPTASTSQIMGNSECIEPYLSNIFVRSTLAGEFIVINEKLIFDLMELKLWNEDMRKLIIINNGSIKDIDSIPDIIKELYKTAFEILQKDIISQSAERAVFIDQSQSLNLFAGESNFDKLYSCHMYSWQKGLKTGMYYLRSKPAIDPIQFGIDVEDIERLTGKKVTAVIDPIDPADLSDANKKNIACKAVRGADGKFRRNADGSICLECGA
jgi:ribonucleoside-diphosphate reductase alpha chain